MGTDLQGPLSGMWRSVYRKAAQAAEGRTDALLKEHAYLMHRDGIGGGGGEVTIPPEYVTDSELATALGPYATDADLAAHAAAADPHAGYVLESLLDAKGDLFAASAADTVGRLAVGTAGQVLTVDAAQTLGVKWATPVAGGMTDPTTTKGDLLARSGDTGDPYRYLAPPSLVVSAVSTDGNVYEWGYEFSCATARPVTAIGWYRPAGAGALTPSALHLWDTTTTASVLTVTSGIANSGAAGWQWTDTTAAGVTLVAGRHYRVAFTKPAGGHFALLYGFDPTPDADLTAYGAYYATSGVYPNSPHAEFFGTSVRLGTGVTIPGAVGRLPVGTNDQVLTADSAETLGVKWAAASGAYLPLVGGTLTGDLVLSEATPTVSLKLAADTQPRSRLTDTALGFGPGGSTAPDATLARTGAGALTAGATLTVTPTGGQPALVAGGPVTSGGHLQLQAGAAANLQLTAPGGYVYPMGTTATVSSGHPANVWSAVHTQGVTSGGHLLLQAGAGANVQLTAPGGYAYPTTDNAVASGHSALRWTTVFAVAGAINTSSRTVKEGITPLDPSRAMEAVRNTEAVTFDYLAPTRGPEWYDLPDDPEQAEQVLQQRLTAAPLEAAARHQSGFIAEDCHELFLVGEGQTSPGNSVGVLLAALRGLDARVQALEGA